MMPAAFSAWLTACLMASLVMVAPETLSTSMESASAMAWGSVSMARVPTPWVSLCSRTLTSVMSLPFSPTLTRSVPPYPSASPVRCSALAVQPVRQGSNRTAIRSREMDLRIMNTFLSHRVSGQIMP